MWFSEVFGMQVNSLCLLLLVVLFFVFRLLLKVCSMLLLVFIQIMQWLFSLVFRYVVQVEFGVFVSVLQLKLLIGVLICGDELMMLFRIVVWLCSLLLLWILLFVLLCRQVVVDVFVVRLVSFVLLQWFMLGYRLVGVLQSMFSVIVGEVNLLMLLLLVKQILCEVVSGNLLLVFQIGVQIVVWVLGLIEI